MEFDSSYCHEGYHVYNDIHCPYCDSVSCWNCAVRCTNYSTGEGIFTCPNCGSNYDGSYCSCQENDLGD